MAKTFALIVGSIFGLFGLVGFVSNPLVGDNALFVTNTAHDGIHVLLGLFLILIAIFRPQFAPFSLKAVGVFLFAFGILGILFVPASGGTLLGIAYTNGPSDWLNFLFSIVVFSAGLYGTPEVRVTPNSKATQK